MSNFWPWWLGALGLAGVTIGFWAILDRPLGVSGSWARVTRWREERARASADGHMLSGVNIDDALMRATLAEFGAQAAHTIAAMQPPAVNAQPAPRTRATPRAAWTSHLIFLGAMFLGGLLSAWSTGQLEMQPVLDVAHEALFGDGMGMWLTLIGGGVLVGFGTQLAGGCTSGHGLSGCANLLPASLVATAIFFSTAVAVSFALEALLK